MVVFFFNYYSYLEWNCLLQGAAVFKAHVCTSFHILVFVKSHLILDTCNPRKLKYTELISHYFLAHYFTALKYKFYIANSQFKPSEILAQIHHLIVEIHRLSTQ